MALSTKDLLPRFGQYHRLTVSRWAMGSDGYDVQGPDGHIALRVEEEQPLDWRDMCLRAILGRLRPFEVSIHALDARRPILQLKRTFGGSHELEVWDGEGQLMGTIVREGSSRQRLFSVEDRITRQGLHLTGTWLRPQALEIRGDEGRILGLLYQEDEGFGVHMEEVPHVSQRALSFAAIVWAQIAYFRPLSHRY